MKTTSDPPSKPTPIPTCGTSSAYACARQRGHSVDVLYANIDFATRFGSSRYAQVCFGPQGSFLGERLFARRAWGADPLGCHPELVFSHANVWGNEKGKVVDLDCESKPPFSSQELLQLEELAFQWVDDFARRTRWDDYKVIGLTSTFEQTAASIALLRAIKILRPDVTTLLGGANCEGEMAWGLQTLEAPVNFFFSGESEETFPDFLDDFARGCLPAAKVIQGSANRRLDVIPRPDFSEYFQQVQPLLMSGELNRADLMIVYESSRGCWWGQKHHCTICGLNGEGMVSRSKGASRVIDDLVSMAQKYGIHRFLMADNIMPHEYFSSLVPRLSAMNLGIQLFYEQKANLTIRNVIELMSAGITSIQPGIESLSTPLLHRMKKGVTASQNIMLLRHAMSVGMHLEWNLLWGFPGDSALEYLEMSELLPLLSHLQPPSGLLHISLDRFSPYHMNPAAFGIENLRPLSCNQQIYPAGSNIAAIAYHFMGDYSCGAYDGIDAVKRLNVAVRSWRNLWHARQTRFLSARFFPSEGYLCSSTQGPWLGSNETESLTGLKRRFCCDASDFAIARNND